MSNLVARVVSAFCIPVWQRGSLCFPREATALPDSQFMVFKRPWSNFSWCLHIKFYILNKIFCRSLGNRPVFLFVLIQDINTENTFVKWDHAVFVTDSSERFLSSFKISCPQNSDMKFLCQNKNTDNCPFNNDLMASDIFCIPRSFWLYDLSYWLYSRHSKWFEKSAGYRWIDKD